MLLGSSIFYQLKRHYRPSKKDMLSQAAEAVSYSDEVIPQYNPNITLI